MNKTDSKDQHRKEEKQRKPRASALRCWCWDCASHTSQAPLPPGSLLDPSAPGKQQQETGQQEERRDMLHEVQFRWGIPPAAAESTSPRATFLWSNRGCQMPPRVLPKQKYVPHLPERMPQPHEAPPRKILVMPSLPFCYFNPKGGASVVTSFCVTLVSIFSVVLSAFLHLCNQFSVLNLLHEICRVVSVCWLDPGLIWRWNWKVKRKNVPALCCVAETGVDLPICTEVQVQRHRGSFRATYPHVLRLFNSIIFHKKFNAGKMWGVMQTQPTFWFLRTSFKGLSLFKRLNFLHWKGQL